MSLPELSIKRPVLATVMTTALVLLGIVSLLNLKIAEYPNMSYPYVSVQINYDGVQAIGIEVGKQSGGNAVKVAAAVKEELNKLQNKLPDSVQVHLVRDDARRIKDSMHGVYEDLILGGIFAVLVVFIFLGDIRSTLISAVTIPTSLIATFFFMSLAGFSINTMSMLGLSLAIGLLIDDAIVVVENVIRHRENGEDQQMAAALGTKEIVLAVMATSFSVIAVFMPMGFMTGSMASFLKEFGLTISFAVLISLFISFTLTPMLASKFLRPEGKKTGWLWCKQQAFSRFFDRLALGYGEIRAHDLGVANETIGSTVATLLEGKKTGKFSDTEEQVDVRLRLKESARENPSQLNFIQVVTGRTDSQGNHQLVPLAAVADWKYETSPGSIRRYERQKEVRISANVDGVSLGEFEQQWEEKLASLELPPGVSTGSAGEATEMDETMKSILQTLVLGIAFIFMILAAQFESFLEPLAIMAALPLAFIGALAGLLIFGSGFSMISGIGILLLMGLVTKNAILLVDYAKARMAEGMAVNEALVAAGKARFRPIMMTTLAMMMGMLPLAMALGPGAEARAPMAHAILGGLVTSTVLTLVVIPCLYSLLRGCLNRRRAPQENMICLSPKG